MLAIIIPAYKRENSLREALWSLVNQTNKKFFTIVVDDHSPEPLKPITEEFSDKLNIHYIYAEKNGGPGSARQLGLECCYKNNIELVMFLDSDDKLFPQAVDRLTYEINHGNYDIVSSEIWVEDGKGLGEHIDSNNHIWLHGKIYRVSYLKKIGLSFPPIRTNEDLSFNLSALELTDKKAEIREALYLFRHEENSITRNGDLCSKKVISSDYILALYYGITKLLQHKKLREKIVLMCYYCYNYYQNMKCLNIEITEDIKQKLRFLLNLGEEFGIRKKVKMMFKLQKSVGHYLIEGDKIYYYEQTFKEWLEEFIDESSNN